MVGRGRANFMAAVKARGGGGGKGRGRGGGGGGKRGGRGGGGGGGKATWGNPKWRAQKLAEMKENGGGGGKPRQVLDPAAFMHKLMSFKSSPPEEMEWHIKENYGRDGFSEISEMAENIGLFCKSYGKGTSSVIVVSKAPLPNYRHEFDNNQEEHTVDISGVQEAIVLDTLDTIAALRERTVAAPAGMNGHGGGHRPAKAPRRSDGAGIRRNKRVDEELQRRQMEQSKSPEAKRMSTFRQKLPAFNKKEAVLAAVASSQVLVISGETGCGKTTQVPQFVLEEAIANGEGSACNILCTQPRRISAISVADRVANERGERLGASVGYQIRLEAKRSRDTRLLFCTTGVLLRRLVNEPDLDGVSHVVVDEIHERGMNEDFLLIILRDLLPRRPDLRVILMSATLNAELFSSYFGGAPVLHIPGFTYPVEQIFLEDFLERSQYRVTVPQSGGGYGGGGYGGRGRGGGRGPGGSGQAGKKGDLVHSPHKFTQYSPQTQRSLETWAENCAKDNKPDVALVEGVVEYICRYEEEGAILVFLTGWDDIQKLNDAFSANPLLRDKSQYRILPLHGSMATTNQQQIFERPPKGVRKIVIATNIAETSITIDDIVFVVDGGKAKEKTYDAVNKLSCLLPTWVSRASARQRKGRAGRVRPGKAFHLYTREFYEEQMIEYQLPEMLRTPLEELCLEIKSLSLGNIEAFLSKALEPPDLLAIMNAVELLEVIGAMTRDETLTPLGMHLSALPVDPRIGKMIIMGAIFGCLDPILTIAAGLAYRDPFVMPLEKKELADEVKRRFAGGTQSDHIAILRAFEGYKHAYGNGGYRAMQDYCWHNFLSKNTLEMIEDMRHQFVDVLDESGFLATGHGMVENGEGGYGGGRGGGGGGSFRSSHRMKAEALRAMSVNGDNLSLVKAVVCAGTFPNLASVQQKKKRAAFRTPEDGKVDLHPSSVNAVESHFGENDWMAYSDKVRTHARTRLSHAPADRWIDRCICSCARHISNLTFPPWFIPTHARVASWPGLAWVYVPFLSFLLLSFSYASFLLQVKSTGIFVRASTAIPTMALLLFGGEVETKGGSSGGRGGGGFGGASRSKGTSLVTMLGGYVRVRGPAAILTLREGLEVLLQLKFQNPAGFDIMQEGGEIVEAVIALLDEGMAREIAAMRQARPPPSHREPPPPSPHELPPSIANLRPKTVTVPAPSFHAGGGGGGKQPAIPREGSSNGGGTKVVSVVRKQRKGGGAKGGGGGRRRGGGGPSKGGVPDSWENM